MEKVVRFSVSIDRELSDKFTEYLKENGYSSRSEALCDLIRASFVEDKWENDENVAAAISFVYDHHKRDLLNKLMHLQHSFHHVVLSTQHVHLDHHTCLEILVAKGVARDIMGLFNAIKAMKGVRHAGIIKTGSVIE